MAGEHFGLIKEAEFDKFERMRAHGARHHAVDAVGDFAIGQPRARLGGQGAKDFEFMNGDFVSFNHAPNYTQPRQNMPALKLGIIGCGSIGKRHIRNALDLGCEVSAYDVEVSAFAELPKSVKCSQTWPEDADACIICTPADQHAAHAVNCWRRNTPVLVEKPLALSIEQWVVRGPHAWPLVMVGYNWRMHRVVRELRQRIVGVVGTQRCEASFWYIGNRATWPGKSYADTLLECSHEIDLALHLLGPACCVEAKLDGTKWTLTLQHAHARSLIVLDDHANIRSRGARMEFSDGTMDGYQAVPWDQHALNASYRDELAHFLSCVRDGSLKAPACSLSEGLAVLQICDDARRLAEKAA